MPPCTNAGTADESRERNMYDYELAQQEIPVNEAEHAVVYE